MKARLLDMGQVSVLRSQSIYHGLTAAIKPDDDPIITMMTPKDTYVSVGHSQETEKEVDLDYCTQEKIPVIRRHVGGGAVLLDSNQLFFHVILPVAFSEQFGLPRKLVNKFAYLARPPIHAYHKLGINAAFRPVNDIHVEGKKIGGTGTGEIRDGLVFAGSMMMDFNHALMAKVLKVPDEKMRDKIHETLEAYITTIKRELGKSLPVAEVAEALVQSFEEVYGIELTPSVIQERELKEVEKFDEYLSEDDWLHKVQLGEKEHRDIKISSNVRILGAAHKAPGGMIKATVRVVDESIDDLIITGDFAFSPPDGLEKLSNKFRGANLDMEELKTRISSAYEEETVDFAGVEIDDFEQVFAQLIA
ncbi:MAG: lipoate protein ligase C-terminal domain-containing protein [Candidatus Marinimicrobia bacterium]|nr:lipoate protein ligase C-terminal domain-containing protein [Candidatus Neomarinimicrobiota bacterium]MDP7060631.1 lipoate protein ligase C-terminal domain-containing protein [Candidatus Neomarinimicrobiota bacterium]|tara:strand:+ start:2242 stop:3327 length:1086 start_codon:yes stop_codon:yes gene_type:complete